MQCCSNTNTNLYLALLRCSIVLTNTTFQKVILDIIPERNLENFMNVSRNLRKSGLPEKSIMKVVPFKGCGHFKCYNLNKPAKYHIKMFKMCDSSNSYCSKFDLYVGKSDITEASKYGKTHNVVFSFMDPYLGKGYTVFMDN